MSDPIVIDQDALRALSDEARTAPRLRKNRNLHEMDDPVHRLLNATEPGTYVQPHRHLTPPKPETLTVLRGRGAIVCFDDMGHVTRTVVLRPGGPVFAAEIPPDCWHTLIALEPGTVWLESKAGPYVPPPPEDRASWAPAEGDGGATAWLQLLLSRIDGDLREAGVR